jgi:hypothetical protein
MKRCTLSSSRSSKVSSLSKGPKLLYHALGRLGNLTGKEFDGVSSTSAGFTTGTSGGSTVFPTRCSTEMEQREPFSVIWIRTRVSDDAGGASVFKKHWGFLSGTDRATSNIPAPGGGTPLDFVIFSFINLAFVPKR